MAETNFESRKKPYNIEIIVAGIVGYPFIA